MTGPRPEAANSPSAEESDLSGPRWTSTPLRVAPVDRKKALTERALNGEMDHHLAGDDGAGNTCNGYGRKTVTTDTGSMAIEAPRARQARFNPQLIDRYQRRFRRRVAEGWSAPLFDRTGGIADKA